LLSIIKNVFVEREGLIDRYMSIGGNAPNRLEEMRLAIETEFMKEFKTGQAEARRMAAVIIENDTEV
jgi:hypothetical protein